MNYLHLGKFQFKYILTTMIFKIDLLWKQKKSLSTLLAEEDCENPLMSLYILCGHASSLNRYIFRNEKAKEALLNTENPRKTFIEGFVQILKNNENSVNLLTLECVKGHISIPDILNVLHSQFLISIVKTMYPN